MTKEESEKADLSIDIEQFPRSKGALLAAAIGDALGWAQEKPNNHLDRAPRSSSSLPAIPFQPWRRRSGGRFWSHVEEIKAGEYSDDTQLLLATARSLTHGSTWYEVFTRQELPIWLLYERGGGSAVRTAAKRWLEGIPPWRDLGQDRSASQKYFMAGGNGVAMRVLPHSLLREQTPLSLCRQVMLNGTATHGHPRALLGAALYAEAAWWAARIRGALKFGGLLDYLLGREACWPKMQEAHDLPDGWAVAADTVYPEGYAKIWHTIVKEVSSGLEVCRAALTQGALSIDREVMEQLGCFDQRISGAGTVTALAAVYLATRYAADPKTGLLEAAFADRSDTDTIASMAGGLLGALCGSDWIDTEWQSVQDREYIFSLASILADTRYVEAETKGQPVNIWAEGQSSRLVEELERGASQVLVGPLGTGHVRSASSHQAIAESALAKSWEIQTISGQIIYVKKLARRRVEASRPTDEPSSKSVLVAGRDEGRPSQSVLDPGIYLNLFEVLLSAEFADVMVVSRQKIPDLTEFRNHLRDTGTDAHVYAWDDSVFGYGPGAQALTKRGFVLHQIALREHPQLTERMILDGYVQALAQAGYTIEQDREPVKQMTRVYQMQRPVYQSPKGVRMFRGFALSGQYLWDPDNEEFTFAIRIDPVFAYRDQENSPLSAEDVATRFGSDALNMLRQKQGDFAPTGKVNLEVARHRLFQQLLPFVDARHAFQLPCGVQAELSRVPTRVVLVSGAPPQ